MRSLLFCWPAFVALLAAPLGMAGTDDMDVPVSQQVPLLTRVLSFDRALAGSSPLVIGVVYQAQNRESRQAHDAFVQTFESRPATVQGRAVRVVSIALSSSGLARSLRQAGAQAAYVTPMRGVDVGTLAREASGVGVRTLTGVRRYVSDGVSVGVGLRNGRPEILLNRRSATASGADLSSRLLQLATIVDA